MLGKNWKKKFSKQRKQSGWARGVILSDPALLNEVLEHYKNTVPEKYDFDRDPANAISWYVNAKGAVEEFPLALRLKANPTTEHIKTGS